MKAAILPEFGQPLRIEDVPTPVPGADEVLIQVEACGVCHSDLHIAHGDLAGFRAATKERVIPGHEVVGKVVAKGADVAHLAIGDRVGVAWLHWACGVCEQCREGLENLCRKGIVTGMMVDGGFAEFMRAKASHALKIPPSLDPAEAAPLFCAGVTVYRALRNAGVGPGQRVAVFGVGGLGHVAVQIAKAFGAEVHGFDVTDADTVKAVRKLGGMHVAVVTSAAKAAYDMALRCVRPAGTLAVVGLPAEPLAFQALALVGSEVRIVSAAVGTRDDLRATLELAVAGKLRCRIEEVPLAAVNDVFERMQRGAINGRMVLRCC
jgi:propanol-preferring alcohol dehydrogenase